MLKIECGKVGEVKALLAKIETELLRGDDTVAEGD